MTSELQQPLQYRADEKAATQYRSMHLWAQFDLDNTAQNLSKMIDHALPIHVHPAGSSKEFSHRDTESIIVSSVERKESPGRWPIYCCAALSSKGGAHKEHLIPHEAGREGESAASLLSQVTTSTSWVEQTNGQWRVETQRKCGSEQCDKYSKRDSSSSSSSSSS